MSVPSVVISAASLLSKVRAMASDLLLLPDDIARREQSDFRSPVRMTATGLRVEETGEVCAVGTLDVGGTFDVCRGNGRATAEYTGLPDAFEAAQHQAPGYSFWP